MLKVLWLSNIIFDDSEGDTTGTWLIAMARGLKDSLEIDLASVSFGFKKKIERKDTKYLKQWLLPLKKRTGDNQIVYCLDSVINEFRPSIINVWGTEEYWGLHLKKINNLPPTLLCIQGLMGVISRHYLADLSWHQIIKTIGLKEILTRRSILQERQRFLNWKIKEEEIIQFYNNICVQSQWSLAHVSFINKNSVNYYNDIVLREAFYTAEKWHSRTLKEKSIFFSAAYPAPFKGLHIAIQALSILKTIHPDIKLKIAGYHPREGLKKDGYVGFVTKMIKILDLKENVIWLGSIDSKVVVKEMLNSSVVVVPSFIESYCVVLAESMFLGLPVVASYAGGMSSLGQDEDNVLFFSPGDVESCAHNINRILCDESFARKISKSAIQIASYRSNKIRIINEQIRIYNNII
jgi:glycosyltransferase involved in cell wall biosynthesis